MITMTLEEKIGQLVIIGLEGYAIDANTLTMLHKHHVGGFIFFKRNIKSKEQTKQLVDSLQAANKSKIPLFISVDEEGGRVSRLPQEYEGVPACKSIGDANDEQLAFETGKTLAKRVKTLGFNMNYAPVLDVNSNPDNPVIGDRAFGDNVDVVTRLGIKAMQGIESQGVIPVVKHFPGHGDTSVDSHFGLPRVDADLDRLSSLELLPFQEAIKQGAGAVMTAHILLPRIDPDYPATLSRPIITDILRKQLGYDGVVITDCLTMAAIKDHYEMGAAAVKAINAGVDIALVCHEHENYLAVISALKQAILAGEIPLARVDEAVTRVLRLKQRMRAE